MDLPQNRFAISKRQLFLILNMNNIWLHTQPNERNVVARTVNIIGFILIRDFDLNSLLFFPHMAGYNILFVLF